MYIQRNIEARSRNRCYSGKAIIITFPEHVFVALFIHHAKRIRHIVICGLSVCLYNIFHIISQTARFSEKKLLNVQCVF
jgi:hypothetical protein